MFMQGIDLARMFVSKLEQSLDLRIIFPKLHSPFRPTGLKNSLVTEPKLGCTADPEIDQASLGFAGYFPNIPSFTSI